jgi:heme exporter protein C
MMQFFKNNWWKILALLLLLYVFICGLLCPVPQHVVIYETIRNLYFHVGMWFSMIMILFAGLVFSIRFLRSYDIKEDQKALAAVKTGLLFGVMGLLTGMVWARFTWGVFWTNDPKLNGAAVGMMSYLAYMVLRSSVDEAGRKARLAAVYNVFAFVLFFVFIMIIPRLASASLHPGIDANPALVPGDLAPVMRKVFYPAVVAWMLFAWWVFTIFYRVESLHRRAHALMDK